MSSRVDIKVVLLGKEFVGKTALKERFLHEHFLTQHGYQSTIGGAYGSKCVRTKDNHEVVLGIWDTAGSERYESMTRIYYRGAGAAVICYDLTEDNSFERAKFWTRELQKYQENCRIYLCGCKKDLVDESRARRQVDMHDVRDFSESIEGAVFETSAKTGENIELLFRTIADDYVNDPARHPNSKSAFDLAATSNSVQQGHSSSNDTRRCAC